MEIDKNIPIDLYIFPKIYDSFIILLILFKTNIIIELMNSVHVHGAKREKHNFDGTACI